MWCAYPRFFAQPQVSASRRQLAHQFQNSLQRLLAPILLAPSTKQRLLPSCSASQVAVSLHLSHALASWTLSKSPPITCMPLSPILQSAGHNIGMHEMARRDMAGETGIHPTVCKLPRSIACPSTQSLVKSLKPKPGRSVRRMPRRQCRRCRRLTRTALTREARVII